MSNTSLLDTNLNAKPWHDDYNPGKQFYRILFKPSTAVQVRELNQLQSILQNQIASFGQNIFKEGSVIQGCAFTFDNKYSFVKVSDTYANGTALTVADLSGAVVSNPNGLEAIVVDTRSGLVSEAPDVNTLYVKYLNTGVYSSNGGTQTAFGENEVLTLATEANTSLGEVSVANVANVSGYGYAFTTTEGIIFKKGFFVYVAPQTIIVDKYSNMPTDISVGFDARESIVTTNNDESLYENAAGAPNFTAPGADRLKLESILVTRSADSTDTDSFFSLVDFKDGLPITIRNDAQFNSVAREVQRRTFETNGNFVVNPFAVTTAPLANTSDADYANNFNAIVSKGLGYVEGARVEYLNNNTQKVRRGVDFESIDQQNVSLNFGYYILVNELTGRLADANEIIEVELHNTAKTSITSDTYLATSYSSTTRIGTAYVRGISYESGVQGSSDAQSRLYLFNVQMNAGMNFRDVRSVIYYSGSLKGVADVVLGYNLTSNTYNATVYNTSLNTMIYPFGQNAIKTDGFSDTEFVYRKIANSSILTDGSATVTVAAPAGLGDEAFLYTGTLSSTQMNDFVVIPTTNGYSSNKTGTVQTYNTNTAVVGTSTVFATEYNVGDTVLINSALRKVSSITNNTFMSLSSNSTANSSGLTHKKAFIAGNPIPFASRSTRSMSIAANTLTLSIGETANAVFNIQVVHSLKRSATTSIKKQINKSIYVKINCSNNSGTNIGPWSLGLPDAFELEAVYVDTTGNQTYSNSGTNYVDSFKLDSGQRDTFYDLSRLKLKTASIADKLTSNTTILVKLSAFTYNTSQGKGFFDASSYPIDDANTANTNAITTAEIPTYVSTSGSFYDLRNCLDFRPYSSNTAVVTQTVGSATVNPSSTVAFNYTPYLPASDSIMQTNLQYYLARVDRLSIDTNGRIVVTEGMPAVNNPPAPLEKSGTMTLALLKVPPYPSLTTKEAKEYGRYDLAVTSQPSQNRRYTMRDIAQFDKRISNLEYYTSLSLLESATASLQVRSTDTGQNRFQNGIFVDPFNGFDLCNTKHPKFYIAIDDKRTELRPAFVQMRSEFALNEAESTNVQQHGDLVLLSHTSNNVLVSQQYASKFRNCIEGNIYTWRGSIVLTPTGSLAPDTTVAPDVVNNIDLAQNWINLENAWGTQWGNWETINITYANTSITTSTSTTERVGDPIVGTTESATTTGTPYYIWGAGGESYAFGGYLPEGVIPQNSGINGIIGPNNEAPGTTVYGFS